MSKHEEWLAAFVDQGGADALMHFNDKHDSNGRFAKKNGGSSSSSTSTSTSAKKIKPTGYYTAPQGPVPYPLNVTKEEVSDGHVRAKEAFSNNCFGLTPNEIDTAYAACTNDDETATATDNITRAYMASVNELINNYVLESQAYKLLQDGEYHSEREFLQGSARLANQVYMDLQMIYGGSRVMNDYLKTQSARDVVSQMVGTRLGELFAAQTKPSDKLKAASRKKNVDESATGGVKKRETITREQLKKENPDLPAAALDAMLKGKTELEKRKKKTSMRGSSAMPGTVKHEDEFGDFLVHFNPNHDPRNGQFAKSTGAGISAAASNKKAQLKNAAIRAKRVPERVAKVKRIGAFTAAGAVAGASIALGLMTGGFGAMPMAAVAASTAAKTGAGLFGAYMGGMIGTGAGIGKEAISDYLKGKGPDADDWDRYIRSNTNYDRLL